MKKVWHGALCVLLALCQSTLVEAKDPPGADAAWEGFTQRYLAEYCASHPERAVNLGFHQFDGKLPDLSRAGIARDVVRLQGEQREAAAFDPARLSEAHRFERAHLLAYFDEQLFWLVSAQDPFHNPSYYQRALGGSANLYVLREYAPPATRMKAYIAYAKAVPDAIAQVRENLHTPLPRSYVDIGKTMFSGLARFYEQYAPAAFASVQDEKLQGEFREANAAAIASAKAMAAWLDTLRPTATESFALGAARFSEMLRASEGVDLPLARLEQLGRDDLARNHAALDAACARFAPGKSTPDCVAAVQAHKPEAGVVETAGRQLGELKAFLVAKQLVTIPGTTEARVEETPPHMRFNPAFLFGPGGYEKKDVPAIYFVSLPDPAWSEAERKAYVPDIASLQDISVHEVWPGHFLQSLWLRRDGVSVVARTAYNNSASEGWAHYGEEMMLDAGLGADNAEDRVAQLLAALVRDVRYLSAIGLQAGRMTVAESEQLFRESAFADPATARQQAARGTFDPAYLDYTLGKLMIRKLRDDWTATRGGRAAWRAFHDQYLSYGAAPVPLVRAFMLGPDAGSPL
jgi:uncharacterized protein (DUF885 family)